MARNVEKAAGVMAVGPVRMALGALAIAFGELAPFAVLVMPGVPEPLRALSAIVCAVAVTVSVVGNRWMGQPVFPALWVPLGTLVGAALMLRAALLALWRGGIYWRETFYSLDVLKAGSRLRLS